MYDVSGVCPEEGMWVHNDACYGLHQPKGDFNTVIEICKQEKGLPVWISDALEWQWLEHQLRDISPHLEWYLGKIQTIQLMRV